MTWREKQQLDSKRQLNRVCEIMGASPVFRAKYRGKCTDCGGTGVIAQGNDCVIMDEAIYHFECAARLREREKPCESCGATGQQHQRGPKSDKRVCVECAIKEISQS